MEDLVVRLIKRATIRRQILTRKSVQEGKPDRLAALLDEAAYEIERLRNNILLHEYVSELQSMECPPYEHCSLHCPNQDTDI